MNNTRWETRTFARAREPSDEDPGGGGGTNLGAQARLQGAELQREAAKKKFYFQQKMELEGNRKTLGKGNIVTFLIGDAKQVLQYNDFNKVLRVAGFTPDQVLAI